MIIYYPGVWDMFHIGHLRALQRAASYGEVVVGVPSDQVVLEDKGRPPILTLLERVALVEALRCVDRAMPYYSLDFLPALRSLQPMMLAVGEDWGKEKRHLDAERWCEENHKIMVRIQRTPGISTSDIIERIKKS